MSYDTILVVFTCILGSILIFSFGAMMWKTYQVSKEFKTDKKQGE